MMKATASTLILVTCLFAVEASATLVTIDATQIYARARDGAGPTNGMLYTGTANTASTSLIANSGVNMARTDIDFSGTANSQSFTLDYDQTRGTTYGSFAKSDAFNLAFTANSDSAYTLSGDYITTATEGTTFFSTSLYDVTDAVYLFRNVQENRGLVTLPTVFELGQSEGNWGSVTLEGSLTGELQAGHQYRLLVDAFIQAIPIPQQGASATGQIQLAIAVPLPASALCFLIGLCFLAFRRA